jgi:hypothetical protein
MTAAKDLLPGDRIVVSTPTHYCPQAGVVNVRHMTPELAILTLSDGTVLPVHPDDLLEAALRARPMVA